MNPQGYQKNNLPSHQRQTSLYAYLPSEHTINPLNRSWLWKWPRTKSRQQTLLKHFSKRAHQRLNMHPNIFTDACRYSLDRSERGKLRWRRRHDRNGDTRRRREQARSRAYFQFRRVGVDFISTASLNGRQRNIRTKFSAVVLTFLLHIINSVARSRSDPNANMTRWNNRRSFRFRWTAERAILSDPPSGARRYCKRASGTSPSLKCRVIREEIYLEGCKLPPYALGLPFPV